MNLLDSSSQCIVFKIGNWHFSIANEEARLILRRNELGSIQLLPDMSAPLIGVTNIQGHARTLLDPGLLLECPDEGKKNILVIGALKDQSAILIDELPWSLNQKEYTKVALNSIDLPSTLQSWCRHAWHPNDEKKPWLLHLQPYDVLLQTWQLHNSKE